MKKLFLFAAAALVMASCGGKKDAETNATDNNSAAPDVEAVDDVEMDEMVIPDEIAEIQEIEIEDAVVAVERGEFYHLTGGMPGDNKNKMDIEISGNEISGTYEMINDNMSFTISHTLRGKIDGNKADIKAYDSDNDLAFTFTLDFKFDGNNITATGTEKMDDKSWNVTFSGSKAE